MVREKDISSLFFTSIGKPVEQAVSLSQHSHFCIGGHADFFFTASTLSDLLGGIRFSREHSLPYYIIGGGYNLLFDDRGYRGLIIKNRIKGIRRRAASEIEILSGTHLEELIRFCIKEGLSGLEFLAGIPGTVGGAVSGNAGAFNQEIGDFLKEADLLNDEGDRVSVGRNYFAFGYRESSLQRSREMLLRAVFSLQRGNRDEMKVLIDDYLERRKKKHPPMDIACAGSYFKNPVLSDGKKVPAAQLLDEVGAKNLKRGGAQVFSDHANFIINAGSASSADVLGLAAVLKERVKDRFGVELEEEVIFLPAEPS